MTQIDLNSLEERIRRFLQARAAEHGRSIEDEVRDILTKAVQATPSNGTPEKLGSEIVARFRDCALDGPIPELRLKAKRG